MKSSTKYKIIKVKPEWIGQLCPNCKGHGTVQYGKRTCVSCNGEGIIKVPCVEKKKDGGHNG